MRKRREKSTYVIVNRQKLEELVKAARRYNTLGANLARLCARNFSNEEGYRDDLCVEYNNLEDLIQSIKTLAKPYYEEVNA